MRLMSRLINLSLASQLILTYIIALFASFASVAVFLYFTLIRDDTSAYHHAMLVQAKMLVSGIQYDARKTPIGLTLPNEFKWIYETLPSEIKYRLVNQGGTALLASDKQLQPLSPQGGVFNASHEAFDVTEHGNVLHVITTPFDSDGHQYFLQVANSDRLYKLVQKLLLMSAIKSSSMSIIVSLILVSIAMLLTLRRLVKPLRALSADAAGISPRNLQQRIMIKNCPPELQPLITALNDALSRLEQGYKVQQEFLAAAAHELKTPLALIRGQIEMEDNLSQPSQTTLLGDVDYMARQVHQLLHLTEVSEVQNYQFKIVDVNLVIEDVAAYLQRYAEHRKIVLLTQLPLLSIMVNADKSALFILLKNLVENAILHTPQGETVVIHATSTFISVQDHGAGIANSHLPFLFERFWRGPERQNEGAGLGLAICNEIAIAHHWYIQAANTPSGAVFTVYFHLIEE